MIRYYRQELEISKRGYCGTLRFLALPQGILEKKKGKRKVDGGGRTSWIVCCGSLRGEKNHTEQQLYFLSWFCNDSINRAILYRCICTIKSDVLYILVCLHFPLFERSPSTTGSGYFEDFITCLQDRCWHPILVSHRMADRWCFGWLHSVCTWCFQFRGSLRCDCLGQI